MEQHKETVLVTGGSGFVGSYCILQLLAEGYEVKTTIRTLNKKEDVISQLKKGGAKDFSRLTFVEGDLTKDDNWDEAVRNCTFVLHVASPFPATIPDDENELIAPARDGALRVLRAARDAGVKRVILTSSFAAIGYSIDPKDHVFTEEDWTDPEVKNSAYVKSKTLAELAAWAFIREEGNGMELSVINPVGIFGPVLGPDFSNSIGMVRQLLTGKMPDMPQMSFGVVDVRDVADIHLLAMKHPDAKGQRFLATSDGTLSFPEIGRLLHGQKEMKYEKVTTNVMPAWLVKRGPWFKPELKAAVPQLGMVKKISNEKAQRVLGWQPRDKETAIFDTAESLIRFNLV